MGRTAVVVGRFQTPYLHKGHTQLIDHAFLTGDDKAVIFIGTSSINSNKKDPLDYHVRARMIKEYIEDKGYNKTHMYEIHSLVDIPFSDKLWVEKLDEAVDEIKDDMVVMLGGRDSFLKTYQVHGGKYSILKMPEIDNVSATKERAAVDLKTGHTHSRAFRSGIIYAQQSKRFANIYPTVDAIVWKDGHILLGRKHGETTWRMPGGFLDPTDKTLEAAAVREVHEECGMIELGNIEYFTSGPVEDRRYKGLDDTVYTTVFAMQCLFGAPKAGDDLEEVKWISVDDIQRGNIDLLPGHKGILLDYVG